MAADLVLAAAGGDEAAWNQLVNRYSGLVWAVTRSLGLNQADAADVSQTTWMRLLEHLGSLRNPERVGSWLAVTARHEALRTLRRGGRQIPSDVEGELESLAPEMSEVDEGLLSSERNAELWAAFNKLAPRCQRLLRVLMADPRPSYPEVSTALNMPIGSIGPTRSRCLDCLRQQLERNARAHSSATVD